MPSSVGFFSPRLRVARVGLALALEANHSGWICNAMDQLLGRDTGRVFNDEAAAVAVGAQSPEQATKTIENS
jgi:hypothetical protein